MYPGARQSKATAATKCQVGSACLARRVGRIEEGKTRGKHRRDELPSPSSSSFSSPSRLSPSSQSAYTDSSFSSLPVLRPSPEMPPHRSYVLSSQHHLPLSLPSLPHPKLTLSLLLSTLQTTPTSARTIDRMLLDLLELSSSSSPARGKNRVSRFPRSS